MSACTCNRQSKRRGRHPDLWMQHSPPSTCMCQPLVPTLTLPWASSSGSQAASVHARPPPPCSLCCTVREPQSIPGAQKDGGRQGSVAALLCWMDCGGRGWVGRICSTQQQPQSWPRWGPQWLWTPAGCIALRGRAEGGQLGGRHSLFSQGRCSTWHTTPRPAAPQVGLRGSACREPQARAPSQDTDTHTPPQPSALHCPSLGQDPLPSCWPPKWLEVCRRTGAAPGMRGDPGPPARAHLPGRGAAPGQLSSAKCGLAAFPVNPCRDAAQAGVAVAAALRAGGRGAHAASR